jgi:hypothetical protein
MIQPAFQLRSTPQIPVRAATIIVSANRKIGPPSLCIRYALRGLDQSIAVAEWQTQLTDSLPEYLRSSLPTIDEIEAELAFAHIDAPANESHQTRRRKEGKG